MGSLTATLAGYVATKQINGCKATEVTVSARKYDTTSVKGPALAFDAVTTPPECPAEIVWTIEPGAGKIEGNGKSATFTPNITQAEAPRLRTITATDTRNAEATPGTAVVRVEPLSIEITSVTTPSEATTVPAVYRGTDSFISIDQIQGTATISPPAAQDVFKGQIQWDVSITDNDGTLIPSGQAGESAVWMPNPPILPPGRFPYLLKYEINAKVTANGYPVNASPKNIQQDRRDALRQEYTGHDVNVSPIPSRANILDAGTYAGTYPNTNFSFSEVNKGFYPDLIIFHITQHLDNIRAAIGNQTMSVTSGFRNPSKNFVLEGAHHYSAHQFGRAADIALRDWNGDGVANRVDQEYMKDFVEEEGGTTEPFDDTPTWVHMQWR